WKELQLTGIAEPLPRRGTISFRDGSVFPDLPDIAHDLALSTQVNGATTPSTLDLEWGLAAR
ncbi:MAG: hypothetical protein ACI835_004422, partial [Planctomycetota bacterium]